MKYDLTYAEKVTLIAAPVVLLRAEKAAVTAAFDERIAAALKEAETKLCVALAELKASDSTHDYLEPK